MLLYPFKHTDIETLCVIFPDNEVERIVGDYFCFMIDLLLFKKILNADYGFIENNDTIPVELFEMLCEHHTDKIKALFAKAEGKSASPYTYEVHARCYKCGKEIVRTMNKGSLFQMIGYYKNNSKERITLNYLCDECQLEEENKRKQEEKENALKREDLTRKNTDNFISSYLNPQNRWERGISPNSRFYKLLYACVDWERIKEYIKGMDYRLFLRTPYWKAIASKVKIKAKNRCMICNSTEHLSVHHRNYDNHGDEIHHLEDLICICQECHNKHHFE